MDTINKVVLKGVIGGDPDVRYNNKGEKVINLLVGIEEEKVGDKEKKLEWIRVMVIDKAIAYYVETSIRRGSYIQLQGRIKLFHYRGDKYQKPELHVVLDKGFAEHYIEIVK